MSKDKLNRTSFGAVMNACMVGNSYDGKLVDGHIKFIATTGPKLDATIHGVAVVCIYLSMPHSEGGHNSWERAVRLVQTLVDLNKSARSKALIAWFHAYSNIRLRLENGTVSGGILTLKSKHYKPADPASAMAKPFWSVEEKEGDPKAYILGEALANLIKRAEKNADTLEPSEKTALSELTAVFNRLAPPVPAKVEAPAADVVDAPAADVVAKVEEPLNA